MAALPAEAGLPPPPSPPLVRQAVAVAVAAAPPPVVSVQAAPPVEWEGSQVRALCLRDENHLTRYECFTVKEPRSGQPN